MRTRYELRLGQAFASPGFRPSKSHIPQEWGWMDPDTLRARPTAPAGEAPLWSNAIGYDSARRQVCVARLDVDHDMDIVENIIVDSQDIAEIKVVVDDRVVESTRPGDAIGRAMIGGLLAGSVGAIVGGTTSARNQHRIARSIRLEIFTKNPDIPHHAIEFVKQPRDAVRPTFGRALYQPSEFDEYAYDAATAANEWYGTLRAMVASGDQA